MRKDCCDRERKGGVYQFIFKVWGLGKFLLPHPLKNLSVIYLQVMDCKIFDINWLNGDKIINLYGLIEKKLIV